MAEMFTIMENVSQANYLGLRSRWLLHVKGQLSEHLVVCGPCLLNV